jgi:hypothetical protein
MLTIFLSAHHTTYIKPNSTNYPNPLTNIAISANLSTSSFLFHLTTMETCEWRLPKQTSLSRCRVVWDSRKISAIEITETLLEIIKSSLESGDDVLISGFGKFCINEKKRGEGGILLLVKI